MIVVAFLCEGTTFLCAWSLQRLLLRTREWIQVAVPQLAGNAASNILPGGLCSGIVVADPAAHAPWHRPHSRDRLARVRGHAHSARGSRSLPDDRADAVGYR